MTTQDTKDTEPNFSEPETGRRVVYGIGLDRDIREWLEAEGKRRRVSAAHIIREVLLEKMAAAKRTP